MQRPQDDSLRGRIARARARVQGKPPAAHVGPPPKKRRVPRHEAEARRQRRIRWGLAIATVVVLLVITGGILWDNVIKPRQTLARVGDVAITREDYWKVRAYDLAEQAEQYQQLAQFVAPEQQSQYINLAQQSLSQLPAVWGSLDVDNTTLGNMIDDQVYLQGAPELGISLTPEEVRTYALNRFAPFDAPLIAASPTPTFTAERAAMATGTAAALAPSPSGTPALATPVSAGTPAVAAGTPLALATPVASASNSTPVGTPAIPIATPLPGATPSPADARATAEAGFTQFEAALFPIAHLNAADYDRLIAAPELAQQRVREVVSAEVGQGAPQVHAAHILAATQQAADEARARIAAGEDFGDVAREVSTDTGTAPNGGDLGWFTHDEMVPAFADAAFSLPVGEVSQPIASEFGWHLIKVMENDPDHPLTNAQITRLQDAAVNEWLEQERANLGVSSSLPPTPTPFPGSFQPPVAAPQPPLEPQG
ncbi:MAG: peptidylprolyl isomerase [Chloroflexota bacterium]|nr:peptidylprolyl isomerase [Chloroflexota bacterium]